MTTEPDPSQRRVLFLDTEWADDHGRDLVSIAFVGEGASELYAEREPLPPGNEFARRVLYPRLLRGAFAQSEENMVRAVSKFLVLHDNPRVLATHQNDFDLLDSLLVQADKKPAYSPELRFSKSLLECIRSEFAKNPNFRAHRHNALVDARVLRDAYTVWKASWG